MEIFIHIEPTTRIRYSALLCLSSVRDVFDGWRVFNNSLRMKRANVINYDHDYDEFLPLIPCRGEYF